MICRSTVVQWIAGVDPVADGQLVIGMT